ncbi:Activating signal cointegrator 1 [Taenia crassiceps]|uniref:Activating signal cointegrator 1 n=1 Tax=Taenia crassiceps TaxID=6207 RepID=A0ABR4QH06_9CEST
MTKKKFVPLFTESGTGSSTAVLLPGRHPCQCLAIRHHLVGNCTNCGRIVCEQEGSGACYFCGELVVSATEREFLQTNTNAARKRLAQLKSTPWAVGTPTPPWIASRRPRKRYNKIRDDNPEDGDVVECSKNSVNSGSKEIVESEDTSLPDIDAQARLEEGLVKAMLQRDRLLHFDATTAKRTRVIDDELDYFVSDGTGAASVWLDPQTRARVARRVEELREQQRLLRSQSAFGLSIDFNKMTVTEQDLCKAKPGPTEQDLAELTRRSQEHNEEPTSGISDPFLNVPTPQFVSQSLQLKTTEKHVVAKEIQPAKRLESTRVQDLDQQRVVDRGFCLSMHQPWASLLVRGIKRHEGRSWYSAHRGPLWIAATAKTSGEEEVHEVENAYLERGTRRTDFPTSYPTGVLLGCVNVDDVLPQKEYRLKFPDGESESPYVFICSEPRELLIKLPMKGRQRIYRLEAHIHAAAKENLTSRFIGSRCSRNPAVTG